MRADQIDFESSDDGLREITKFLYYHLADWVIALADEETDLHYECGEGIRKVILEAFDQAVQADFQTPVATGIYWPLYWAVLRDINRKGFWDRSNPRKIAECRSWVEEAIDEFKQERLGV
jgi:hypothetical protein